MEEEEQKELRQIERSKEGYRNWHISWVSTRPLLRPAGTEAYLPHYTEKSRSFLSIPDISLYIDFITMMM